MTRRITPALLVALGLALAACPDGPTETDGGNEGLRDDCSANSRGDCVLESEACPASAISQGEGGSTCADCVTDDGDRRICGVAIEARCDEQENAFGDPCQRCTTADGRVLFDDCFVGGQADAVTCEPAGLAGSQNGQCVSDADCPPEHACQDNFCVVVGAADCNPEDEGCGTARPEGPPEIVDDTECEVCRDDNGDVVSMRCLPSSASCADVEIAGRPCTRCTDDDGAVVYQQCAPLEIDPRVCLLYGDDDGYCVDCYGEEDELLSHECMTAPSGVAYCEDVVTFEGYGCVRCYDASGFLLEEDCHDTPPLAERCQELVYTEQTCVACTGPNGELVSMECWSNGCTEPGAPGDRVACPPPAPCQMVFNDDGTLCRVCPSTRDGQIVDEVQCLDDGDLVCVEEEVFTETPGGGDGDGNVPPDAAVVAVRCVVCYDGELEVFRECEDAGVPAPPICETYFFGEDPNGGETCEVCIDPSTGAYVYSSCPSAAVCYDEIDADGGVCTTCYDEWSGAILESTCDNEVCAGVAELIVTDANGAAVPLPGDDATVAGEVMIADCTSCGDPTFGERLDGCTVRTACNGGDGFAPVPVDECALVTMALDVPQCERPWGDGTSGIDEIIAILAWGAVDLGVLFHDATLVGGYGVDACQACECASGERLRVSVRESAAPLLLELGFVIE